MFARTGKCDKDACTFQHVSSDQLKKKHWETKALRITDHMARTDHTQNVQDEMVRKDRKGKENPRKM